MKIEWLGRVEYQAGLRIQEERLDDCLTRGEESVILLEHEPVYTIGRLLDKSSLRAVDHLPYPVFETNRGGQATYHGPGQLVGYPILDLRARGVEVRRDVEERFLDRVRRVQHAGEVGDRLAQHPVLPGGGAHAAHRRGLPARRDRVRHLSHRRDHGAHQSQPGYVLAFHL